ncbi:MAG: DUF4097 family beta strand repeat protein [Verrucomicrobia bacterium]|nr:DUF4097 family beta strand repeat protein [Verrucomicrobiota bacterium]
MKTTRLFPAFVIAAALTLVFLTAARADEGTASIKFSDPAKPGTLKVTLTNGDIHITGTDAAEVTVKTDLKPESPEQRPDGLRVLTSSSSYSLTEKNNVVTLTYGSGDWPGNGGDFAIAVPHGTNVIVASSFGGDVTIEGVTGDLEVKSLNGEVRLDDISGGALVETMNGEIKASVRALNNKPLSFTSMNGEVSLRLAENLKANVRLRTHNGSILTDFDDKVLVTKTESVRNNRNKGNRGPRVSIGDDSTINGLNADEIRAAVKAAVQGANEAAQEAATAAREAAREASRESARAAKEAARAARGDNDDDDTMPVVAPIPPVPPLPPMTGGKIVTGTLNGGGPEIRIATMNGDVTLRRLEKDK